MTARERGVTEPLSYSPNLLARNSQNNEAYYRRRELLYLELRRVDAASAPDLAVALGWSTPEALGKLRSLRKDGFVYYEPELREWVDAWDGE